MNPVMLEHSIALPPNEIAMERPTILHIAISADQVHWEAAPRSCRIFHSHKLLPNIWYLTRDKFICTTIRINQRQQQSNYELRDGIVWSDSTFVPREFERYSETTIKSRRNWFSSADDSAFSISLMPPSWRNSPRLRSGRNVKENFQQATEFVVIKTNHLAQDSTSIRPPRFQLHCETVRQHSCVMFDTKHRSTTKH